MPRFIIFIFFIILQTSFLISQNSLIEVDEHVKDIGTQENIYKIRADYVITNHQVKNLYLLRADAKHGITIRASKKTIKPQDSALIVVEFIPAETGKFKEEIQLVTSADAKSFNLSLIGHIKSIKTDDKTACFYFKKPNNAGVKSTEPIVVTEPQKPRDTSNKIPDVDEPPVVNAQVPKDEEFVAPTSTLVSAPTELEEKLYKPNNITFLVDVSSSMKDTSKLQVMKYALHYLIENLRAIDKITIITYADTAKIIRDGISGNNKEELVMVVDSIKAKGMTKGNKAILYCMDKAIKNYIPNGNNQIILITDGKFSFNEKNRKSYLAKKGNYPITLSTIGLGKEKEALKNLKEIAELGEGHFIHIRHRKEAKELLMDEIKQNSLIR